MKTLKCDLCDPEAEGETFEVGMRMLSPHYMQAHADVINDPKNGEAEQKKWTEENRRRFDAAKDVDS